LLANAGSGPAGADGLPGISVIVNNEAHVVATAADGSGGDYSSAGGTMRLLRGDVVLTPTFSIAAKTPNTSWISIDSSGNYTVTDPGVDLATATLRAVHVGVNYDRTYTLARSKQGVTGPRLQLTVDNQAFTFTDGAANPSSQTITLEALLNNLSGTATWSTSPSVTLGGSGNTRTLSVANFGANRQVTVTATLGGITDKITLVRVDRDAFGGNANRVPFTRFEGGRGWAAGGAPSGGQPFLSTFEDQAYIVAQPVFSAVGQAHVLYTNPGFPVVPGERLSVSAFAQAFSINPDPQPATWVFYIEYRDATNGNLGLTFIGSGSGLLSQQLSGFTPAVPANARRAVIVLLAQPSGAGTVQMALREPMVTSAVTGQTTHPAYVPGPNASDGADPNNIITIDGSGVINGIGTAGIPVNNNLLPLGNVNRLPFTRFEGARGWIAGGAPSGGQPFLILSDGRYFICAEPVFTLADQNHFLVSNPRIPVVPGERLSVSSRIQAFALSGGFNPNYWQLYFEYYNGSGVNFTSSLIAQGFSAVNESTLHAAFSNVPAGAQTASLVLRYESDGAGPARLAILEPMVTSATTGQTVHPPYAPGPNSDDGADVTATAQRSIEPQFPSIEIKQGEAGHTGNRTVTHVAKRETTTITGGTWSLPSTNLGAGSASINASTGTVTLSGIVASGAYVVRYTHTDGARVDLPVNVTYFASATFNSTITVGFQQIITRLLADGAGNFLEGQVSRLAGGTSGTIAARIEQRQAGDVTWNTVATGTGSPVNASEPGLDNVSATFTNSTGAARVFEFRLTEVRAPGTAGGAQSASETFLQG
jgi:hypothetical protein